MAEMKRSLRGTTAQPRYETSPFFRSLDPNLTVYRQLGTPVFRPRPGYCFLTMKFPLLRLETLVAILLQEGLVGSMASDAIDPPHQCLTQQTPEIPCPGPICRLVWEG